MNHTATADELTGRETELFNAYAEEASDYDGLAQVGGNVPHGHGQDCTLASLEEKGMVQRFTKCRRSWVRFTAKGIALAARNGIDM